MTKGRPCKKVTLNIVFKGKKRNFFFLQEVKQQVPAVSFSLNDLFIIGDKTRKVPLEVASHYFHVDCSKC